MCHRLHRRNVSAALGNQAQCSSPALAGASQGSAAHRGGTGDGGWLILAVGLRGAGGWMAGACCSALPGAPQTCTPCACCPQLWQFRVAGLEDPPTSRLPRGAAWLAAFFEGTVSLRCMSLGCLSFPKGHHLLVMWCSGVGSAGAVPPHQPCPRFPSPGQVQWLSSPGARGCRAPAARPYGDVVPARHASGSQRLRELRRDDLS